jgi:hypothetical protein
MMRLHIIKEWLLTLIITPESMKADYDFENNADGHPVPSIFENTKKMFQIATVVAVIVFVILLITVLAHPEKVGEFMAKIVNGFNSTMK